MFYDKIHEYKVKHKIRTDQEFEALCDLRGGSCSYWKKHGDPTLKTIYKIAEKTNTKVTRWL